MVKYLDGIQRVTKVIITVAEVFKVIAEVVYRDGIISQMFRSAEVVR